MRFNHLHVYPDVPKPSRKSLSILCSLFLRTMPSQPPSVSFTISSWSREQRLIERQRGIAEQTLDKAPQGCLLLIFIGKLGSWLWGSSALQLHGPNFNFSILAGLKWEVLDSYSLQRLSFVLFWRLNWTRSSVEEIQFGNVIFFPQKFCFQGKNSQL